MRTNVIIIHTDQHRLECVGAYGNQDIQTPHLDGLAFDGVLHTNHFCSFPICTPSRYSLLSGMYASCHMGTGNEATLPQGLPTFASELRKAGYRTAVVGKMHFTPTYLDVGFDTMILAEQNGQGRFDDDYHRYLRDLGLLDEIDLVDQCSEYRKNASPAYFQSFGAQPSDLDCEHHSTTYITNHALEQIEQFNPDGGNLLMVGYIKPHHPQDPPEPYASMYDPCALKLLPGYTEQLDPIDRDFSKGYFDYSKMSEGQLRTAMAMYYGSITHIDDGVGKMVDLLKQKGIYDDSLIIFTSDHGDYMGFRHMILKGNAMYDPTMKIPLIIKYPAAMHKTGTNNGLSSNIDMAGTILSVCGLSPAETMCGIDLTQNEGGRDFVIGEQIHRKKRTYMIRTRQHKLLLMAMDDFRMYDLEKDPFESTDVSNDPAYKEVLQELKNMLMQEMLFRKNYSLVNFDAPVVNPLSKEEEKKYRLAMIAYMSKKSTVKPG